MAENNHNTGGAGAHSALQDPA
jgi:WD repeat-containing protein 45